MPSIPETFSPEQAPKQLSNLAFGLIFAAIFSIIALWPVVFGDGPAQLRIWALVVAGLFALPALIFPSVLQPLNNLWVKFGLLMHSIINPILMGLIFFVAVLPTGIIIRLLGKDPLRRAYDKEADSYWLPREDAQFDKEKFKNQF